MDHMKKKKKNSRLKPPFPWQLQSSSSLMAFFFSLIFFLVFLFVSSSLFRIPSQLLRRMIPAPLVVSTDSMDAYGDDEVLLPPVESRVLFPDHVLLLIKKNDKKMGLIYGDDDIYYCSYHSSQVLLLPVLSVDSYDDLRWIARCPLHPYNQTAPLPDLQRGRGGGRGRRRIVRRRSIASSTPDGSTSGVFSWNSLAYAASLDGDSSSVVVFVKGLNLKPDRIHHDPSRFFCSFRFQISENHFHTTNSVAIAAAQEVIRCNLPEIVRQNLQKKDEDEEHEQISVAVGFRSPKLPNQLLPSVAMVSHEEEIEEKKHEMCVCTMLRNQARNLKEWIIYHTWLGVDRWFIYDNNSEDEIKNIISNLKSQGYRISRHPWPWLKTQEAGFSHCALTSGKLCDWVGFLDVDEFFHFPALNHHHISSSTKAELQPLKKMIANTTSSSKSKPESMAVGEIRTSCHSFGPSGLRWPPSQGVMTGYTCRLLKPERHKSIVRPEALDGTLMNVVHHFRLREGYEHVNMEEGGVVINHYKYQVWEVFKVKFSRRVATYVVDWERDENQGSKDRAPGLGKQAVQPSDWSLRFCEVWDTGLRDFVTLFMGDPATGVFPWLLP